SASSSLAAPARASWMPSSNAAIDYSSDRATPSRRSTTLARRWTISSYRDSSAGGELWVIGSATAVCDSTPGPPAPRQIKRKERIVACAFSERRNDSKTGSPRAQLRPAAAPGDYSSSGADAATCATSASSSPRCSRTRTRSPGRTASACSRAWPRSSNATAYPRARTRNGLSASRRPASPSNRCRRAASARRARYLSRSARRATSLCRRCSTAAGCAACRRSRRPRIRSARSPTSRRAAASRRCCSLSTRSLRSPMSRRGSAMRARRASSCACRFSPCDRQARKSRARRDDQHRKVGKPPVQHAEEVVHRGARRAGDYGDPHGQEGEPPLAGGVEQAFRLEPRLELFEGDLQRAGAERLDGIADELVLPLRLVEGHPSPDEHR